MKPEQEAALFFPSDQSCRRFLSITPHLSHFKKVSPGLLLHHELQNVELSWPLGGLMCRLCSDVSRNCLSLMTEPICPLLVTASILDAPERNIQPSDKTGTNLWQQMLLDYFTRYKVKLHLGKYSSLRSRRSFKNWPWYCFISTLPQTSRKSNSSVAVMSARGSMLSIWASQRQPWFRP